jgi:hypothetical protein
MKALFYIHLLRKGVRMSFIVYKFINKNNEILYIGKTTQELHIRIHQHKKDKSWFDEVFKIYYIECQDELEMKIFELYYINEIKTKYNKADANYKKPNIICNHNKWILYKQEQSKNTKVNKTYYNTSFDDRSKRIFLSKKLKYTKEQCVEMVRLRFEEMLELSEIAYIFNEKSLTNIYMICHGKTYRWYTYEYINFLIEKNTYCDIHEWSNRKYKISI